MASTLNPACFREIVLPDSIKSTYAVEEGLDYLSSLSRFNVFIGPNNSGKSRLIRSLFAEIDLAISNGEEPGLAAREARDMLHAAYSKVSLLNDQSDDMGDWRSRTESILKQLRPPFRKTRGGSYEIDKKIVTKLRALADRRAPTQAGIPDDFYDVLRIACHRLDEAMEEDRRKDLGPVGFVRSYIPSLRGLRPLFGRQFGEPSKNGPVPTPYQRRTMIDYFDGSPIAPSVFDRGEQSPGPHLFTGCELYDLIRDRLLGDKSDREVVRDFENFLSERLFSGQDVTLIPHVKYDCLVVKIGSQPERRIYELGDGIQQVIILTFPLFEFREQSLCLFIEEPELFLHPGLQMLLVDTFINPPSDRHQVFVATHSQHFVDMSIDRSLCSVYRVTKEISESTPGRDSNAKHHVKHLPQREMALLRLLGVRNSSVFLANCTVWVEGVTDRLYLRHFLKLYFEATKELQEAAEPSTGSDDRTSFVEGLHYAFVEYGGANITHYTFLEDDGIDASALCGELLLIADRDRLSKVERFSKLEEAIGDRFVLLPCREVENLISRDVLRKVVMEYEREVFEFPEFKEEDYRAVPLGKFIEEIIFADKASKRRGANPYQDTSGTIKDKVGFCEKVIRHTAAWDDLSSHAKELTEKVVGFIKTHNSKSQGRM